MSDKRKRLRKMPLDEVTERCQRAMDARQVGAFWMYYFELALRKMETHLQ